MPKLNTPLNLLLVAVGLLVTLFGYLQVPTDARLPVRWGLDGAVVATMPKLLALLQMPAATALIWAIFYVIARRGTANSRASTAPVLRWGLPILTALFVLVQFVIVLSGLGVVLPFFHAA